MLLEVLLTPAFFIWTMAQKYADIPQRRVVLLLLLASSATLLFIFLARRLRRVRAREMRAVYLNYVALVLASYRTEGKGGKSS
jgi:Ca2+/Na+ antiporter